MTVILRFLTLIAIASLATAARADVVYRINAGGPNYTDADGHLWRSDAEVGFFNIGESFAVDDTVEILGTDLDTIYRSHRFDSSLANPEMSYAFPVTPGYFFVRLHFADTYWGAANRRRFSVEIEGDEVLTNYDIVDLTGNRNVADVQEFVTEVLPGDTELNIDFLHGTIDHPLVCGFEIESIPPSPIIMNGETATLNIVKNSTCAAAANLLTLDAIDPDTDPALLEWEVISPPTDGTVSFIGGTSTGSSVIVCYKPAANQIVSDDFTVEVSDGDVGNIDQIVVTVNLIDIEAPVIECPTDVTVAAGSTITPAVVGSPNATDDFDGAPSLTFSDAVVDSACPVSVIVRRTWTARDDAGNAATCLQRISILDDDTDGDGTVDCEDVDPNDPTVGGQPGIGGNGGGNENGNDNGNGLENGPGVIGGNGGVDPETGQPVPTDECCGGGMPAMMPFMLLGWRRKRRQRKSK